MIVRLRCVNAYVEVGEISPVIYDIYAGDPIGLEVYLQDLAFEEKTRQELQELAQRQAVIKPKEGM